MRIGLTGGIGSGKTLVATLLSMEGIPVFNSDKEALRIVDTDADIQKKIKTLLGSEAFLHGAYNKPFVAKKIFENPELREQLNQIIHPAVRQAFDDLAGANPNKAVVNEAAILFETGADKKFDFMVLVAAPEELRLKRVLSRDKSKEEEVRKRMKAQWTDEQKIPLADFVIHNDDTNSVLLQVQDLLQKIT